MTLEQVLERIPPLDAEAMAQAKQHWDALAKPLHGLGDLEDILIRIAGICRTPRIDLRNKAVVVMCADNGVVAEGISQSGQDVTQIITENLGKGTSTVCHMARAAGADVIPVDIGVASDIHGSGVVHRKIARGTHNFAKQSALRPPCCAGSTAMTSLRPAKWASATRPRWRLSPRRCCMRR